MTTPHPSASQTPDAVLAGIERYMDGNYKDPKDLVMAYRCLDEKGLDHAVYVLNRKAPQREGYVLVLMMDHTREVKRLHNYDRINPREFTVAQFMDLEAVPVLAPDELEMWDPEEEDKSEDRLVEHQSVTLIPDDLKVALQSDWSASYFKGIAAVRQLSMFRFAIFYQDVDDGCMADRYVSHYAWDGDHDSWDEVSEDRVNGMSISEFLGLPVRYTLDI